MTDYTNKVSHYFYPAVEVHFVDADGDPGERRFNFHLVKEQDKVTMLDMAELSDRAQMRFWHESQSTPDQGRFSIFDIHVANMNPLGRMTDREFREGFERRQAETQRAIAEMEAKAQAGETSVQ